MVRTAVPDERRVEDYMALPYRMEIRWEDDCWAARVPELPGLVAAHETWDGLLATLEDAKHVWFEEMVELGRLIPEPSPDSEFSGNLRLRLPKSLHARAARAAERDEVSLNTFLVAAVAEALARKDVQR